MLHDDQHNPEYQITKEKGTFLHIVRRQEDPFFCIPDHNVKFIQASILILLIPYRKNSS